MFHWLLAVDIQVTRCSNSAELFSRVMTFYDQANADSGLRGPRRCQSIRNKNIFSDGQLNLKNKLSKIFDEMGARITRTGIRQQS